MATRHLVALTVAAVSATAQGVTIIDFDALAVGDVVTNQFPEATFSSIAGQENVVRADFDFGPLSFPNYICTQAVGGPLNCTQPTIVDFTLPVNDLTFLALGDNDVGVQATVNVFENAVFSATVDITVDGIGDTIHVVDLSGFTNVTRIEIGNITDAGGLAWDRFIFDVVPAPRLCPWDLNGDGVVNVLDLIDLVMSFGSCEGCPADFDDDGFVNVLDLITLIMNFGPCPGTECVWDVNDDGVVDQSDVVAVTSNLGPCDGCPEDVNGDGVVNGQDAAAVATHFGPCP